MGPSPFRVTGRAGRARTGVLETAHGPIETPVFMPVGTQASVKALASEDVERLDAKIILGNTYHLAPTPGPGQLRFGIGQGGVHVDLRRAHLAELRELPFDGFALGGLGVGEAPEVMHAVIAEVAEEMPAERARYLMGVGTPDDIWR